MIHSIMILLGLMTASSPAATTGKPETNGQVTAAPSGDAPSFTWEIKIQDIIKKKTETYRITGERMWMFGSFSCRVTPQRARREDKWVMQDISLSCESGSVMTVTGATCAFFTDAPVGRRMVSQGKMHLSFAVTTDNGGAVLFESACLEPKS